MICNFDCLSFRFVGQLLRSAVNHGSGAVRGVNAHYFFIMNRISLDSDIWLLLAKQYVPFAKWKGPKKTVVINDSYTTLPKPGVPRLSEHERASSKTRSRSYNWSGAMKNANCLSAPCSLCCSHTLGYHRLRANPLHKLSSVWRLQNVSLDPHSTICVSFPTYNVQVRCLVASKYI